MCLHIVFRQSDIYMVGNWHAEAVEEFEEEVARIYQPVTVRR